MLDLGLGVARDYGLVHEVAGDLRRIYTDLFEVDLTRFNGDESWELPISATFVIDRDGRVAFATADPDYTIRAEPSDVVSAIPQGAA